MRAKFEKNHFKVYIKRSKLSDKNVGLYKLEAKINANDIPIVRTLPQILDIEILPEQTEEPTEDPEQAGEPTENPEQAGDPASDPEQTEDPSKDPESSEEGEEDEEEGEESKDEKQDLTENKKSSTFKFNNTYYHEML